MTPPDSYIDPAQLAAFADKTRALAATFDRLSSDKARLDVSRWAFGRLPASNDRLNWSRLTVGFGDGSWVAFASLLSMGRGKARRIAAALSG